MDEYRPGGPGCLWWVAGVFLLLLLLMAGGGPDSENETPGSSNSRTGTLSGNQVDVLSKNQLNLWSDVQNCYGDYSCMTIVTTTTTSVDNTQNTRTDTRSTTTVTGDRNNVYVSPIDGTRFCAGDDGIYKPCEEGQ